MSMFEDRDPAHYLSPLKTTTVPNRMLWLGCEAESQPEQGLSVERWKCGVVGTTHYTSRAGERRDHIHKTSDVAGLWNIVDGFVTPNRRVVLWTYDLPYQVRVSQALIHLPKHGWRLDKIVLEKQAAWLTMRDNGRSLMMCDIRSWTPVELHKLVSDLAGTGNPHVNRAALASGDYAVGMLTAITVREAVTQLMDWLTIENLGQFRPTGSGQSYTAYRRRFMKHNILVHDNTELLALERAAMWTGRCEAWRHGHIRGGPFHEYDMRQAYCRIAAECDIPTVLAGEMWDPTPGRIANTVRTQAVLADITVTTDVPVLPVRMGGRTLWPVGTFRTCVWDPELRLAINHCQRIRVNRAWKYHRAPALQDFARWTLASMNASARELPPIALRVLKHWSRCLVGRFGLRYRSWQKFGEQDSPDLRLVTFIDTDDGVSTDMLIAGYDRMILSDMQEAPESLPQIPGWVMSECRARLWQAMESVGLDRVVYCDTDSIIVDCGASDRNGDPSDTLTEGGWSVKGKYKRLTIHGPRNLTAESVRRVAGLPLTARQVAPLEFSGQVMRSIKESMRAGQLDCVASIPRKFVLDAPDMRRQHLGNNRTAPIAVHITTVEE